MARRITWPLGGSDAGAALEDATDATPVLPGSLTQLVPVQRYPYASGAVQANSYGVPALVFLWGGAVNTVKVQGVTGSATNGAIFVPAGDTFECDYTAAPYWCVYLLA